MGWGIEVQLIQKHFMGRWPSTIPYTFDNTDFSQPGTGPWVQLIINSSESAAVSVGPNALIRNSGVINLQIFTDALSGVVEAYNIADMAADIFRNKTFSGISCMASTMERIGVTTIGRRDMFQVQVNTPYKYDLPNDVTNPAGI